MPLERTETAQGDAQTEKPGHAMSENDRASETILMRQQECIWCGLPRYGASSGVLCNCKNRTVMVPSSFDRAPSDALTVADIRDAKLDREPWSGQIHPEVKYAVLVQVLKSIRDEQIGACSTVKALAAEALAKVGA
jgi:hypothetical protein